MAGGFENSPELTDEHGQMTAHLQTNVSWPMSISNLTSENETLSDIIYDESYWPEDKDWFTQVTFYLNRYAIPVIVCLGILGNTLSFVVFTRTHLRYQSSSVYLAFLNVADSGYLLMLFISWFGWVDIHIMHWNGWCQTVVYLTYVFSFLSVWTVVAFTVERFIVVFKPLLRQHLCTRKRAKIVLSSLTVFSVLAYSFVTWTVGVPPEVGLCIPFEQFYYIMKIINFLDTVVTLVIPSASLIVLNCCTGYKIYAFLSREGNIRRSKGAVIQRPTTATCPLCETGRENTVHYTARGTTGITVRIPPKCQHKLSGNRQTRSGSKSTSGSTPSVHSQAGYEPRCESKRLETVKNNRSSTELTNRGKYNYNRREFQIRTTRTLVMVSTMFVLLNLPSHAFRLYAFVNQLKNKDVELPRALMMWSFLSSLLYYTNFAVNFLLYVAWSKYFRNAFKALCLRTKNRLRNGVRKLDVLPLIRVPATRRAETTPQTLHGSRTLRAASARNK